MNKRFFGVLIFAFVLATGGGLLTYRSLVSRAPATKAVEPTNRIVVASHDMDAGAIVRDADVQLSEWTGAIPTGASAHPTDFVGRGVVTAVYAREAMIDSRLAPKGAGGGLAAMIPEGMRAFAVRVNDVAGVAGFVTPGMRVDVLINGNSPGGNPALGTLARTLLQNVEVLSAGQEYKKDSEGKAMVSQVVTLLVTPDQAEKMSLATNQTTVQLVLRNPVDRKLSQPPGSALAYLFSGITPAKAPEAPRAASAPKPAVVKQAEAAPPPPPQKPEPFSMRITMGTATTVTKFDATGEARK
jgi:pilus assembly protein CpaB